MKKLKRLKREDLDLEQERLSLRAMAEGFVAPGRYRPSKVSMTIRLDHDVAAWLRFGGYGYQTRLNAKLRKLMQEQYKQLEERMIEK